MMRTRRRPAAYRVYGEDEYLAGVDPLTDWSPPPADEPRPGRMLRRIAGAAALTGAVGTVGGVVGLAGLHARTHDRRETAERLVPSMRAVGQWGRAHAVYATRRRPAVEGRPQRTRARRGTRVRVSLTPTSHVETAARAIAARRPARVTSAARSTPSESASAAQGTPAEPASASQGTVAEPASASQGAVAETDTQPRAQREFGFER